MAEIHLRAQGTPRLINAICDNLLLTAFAEEKKVCTTKMLDEISQRPAPRVARQPPHPRSHAATKSSSAPIKAQPPS